MNYPKKFFFLSSRNTYFDCIKFILETIIDCFNKEII